MRDMVRIKRQEAEWEKIYTKYREISLWRNTSNYNVYPEWDSVTDEKGH